MDNEIEKAEQIIEEYGLKESGRKRENVYKRAFVAKHLRTYGLSTTRIGEKLGKNHSTIIHYLSLYDMYKDDFLFLDSIYPLNEILNFNTHGVDYVSTNRMRIAIFKSDYDKLKEITSKKGKTFAEVVKKVLEKADTLK